MADKDWIQYCQKVSSLTDGPCVKQNWLLLLIAIAGLIALAVAVLVPSTTKMWDRKPQKHHYHLGHHGHGIHHSVEEPVTEEKPKRKHVKNNLQHIVGCAQKDGMMKC